jgi:hypothetical protein
MIIIYYPSPFYSRTLTYKKTLEQANNIFLIMLRCNICLVEKDRETSFYRSSGRICKECKKERSNKKVNPIDEISSMLVSVSINNKQDPGTKICNKCGTSKSIDNFYNKRSVCKECYNKQNYIKQLENKKKGLIIKVPESNPVINIDKNNPLYKFISRYIKDEIICQECTIEIEKILKNLDKYIQILETENYPEGFTRSSITQYRHVAIMSIISSKSSEIIKFIPLPKNYYKYVVEFYVKHKDKYLLKYPDINKEHIGPESMFY